MSQTFTATRRFRLKILACMLRPVWLRKYGPIIRPEYFEQKDEHDFSECILEFYHLYKHPPDVDDVVATIGEEHRDLINSVYLGLDEWDLDFAEDTAVQFAQQQAARIAVLESLADVEKGNLATVVERLRQAMQVGQDIEDLGLDLKADVAKWLADVQTPKVPTGLIHLDIAMEGGLGKGELGVIIAPPNYGKSMALVNIGHGAMGPISRCKVLHFTLEMGRTQVAKRYAARSMFQFPSRGGDNDWYREQFEKLSHFMLPGELKIIAMHGNIHDLRSHVGRLIDTGYTPDLIIVDYGDLVKPTKHRPDRYSELGDIFVDLRELGQPDEFDCPIWTATQTHRASLGKEIIGMEDLADSFQKAWTSDAMVAICQTRDEETNSQCRLFLAKLRDGKSRSMVRCRFYREQQAIISDGFV